MKSRSLIIVMLVFAAALVIPHYEHPTSKLSNTSYSNIHVVSGDSMTIENENATISGTVTVDAGGTLVIRNSIIWVNFSSSLVFSINGEFIIEDSVFYTIDSYYIINYYFGAGHVVNTTFNGLYYLYISYASNFYVIDSTFTSGGNMVYATNSINVTIEHNTFRKYTYSAAFFGVAIINSSGVIKNNDIYSNREFYALPSYGIYVMDSNITIENNIVESNYYGVYIRNSNGTINDNNIFSKNTGILTTLNAYSHVNITGNLLENGEYGIWGNSINEKIYNNTFVGCKYGIYINSIYNPTTIEKNTMLRIKQAPIYLKSSLAGMITFKDNVVDGWALEIYINSTSTIENKDLGSLLIINSTSLNIRKSTIHGTIMIVNSLLFVDNSKITTYGSAFFGKEKANVSISDTTITANEYIFAGYFSTISIGGTTMSSKYFANNYDFLSIATSEVYATQITLSHADIIRSTLHTTYVLLQNDTTFDNSEISSANPFIYFDGTPSEAYISAVSSKVNGKTLLIMVNQSGSISSGDYGYIILINSNVTGNGITTSGLIVRYGNVDLGISAKNSYKYLVDAAVIYAAYADLTLRDGTVECTNVIPIYMEKGNLTLRNLTVKTNIYAVIVSDTSPNIANLHIYNSYIEGSTTLYLTIHGELFVDNSTLVSSEGYTWDAILYGMVGNASIINSKLSYKTNFLTSSDSSFYTANYSGTTVNGHEIQQFFSTPTATINGGNKLYLLYNVSSIDATGEIAALWVYSSDNVYIHSATIHDKVYLNANNVTIVNSHIEGTNGISSDFYNVNITISDTKIDTLALISSSVTTLSVTASTHNGKPIYAKINSSDSITGEYGLILILNVFDGNLHDVTTDEVYISHLTGGGTLSNVNVGKYIYVSGDGTADKISLDYPRGYATFSIEGTISNAKIYASNGYVSLGSNTVYRKLDLKCPDASVGSNLTMTKSKIDVNAGLYGVELMIYDSEIWIRDINTPVSYYFLGDNGKIGNTWYMPSDIIAKYTFDGPHGKYVLFPGGVLARYSTVIPLESETNILWLIILVIVILAIIGIIIVIIKRKHRTTPPPTQ